MIQIVDLIFLSIHNDLVFLIICIDEQYQRPLEDKKICHWKSFVHLELSLLTQLDEKLHRKLNGVIESKVVENMVICISQEDHKLCYR